MSQSSSSTSDDDIDEPKPKQRSWRHWLMIIVLPMWVLVSFLLAQQLVVALLGVLHGLNVPIASLNQSILTTILSVFVYIIAIALVIGLPWLVRKKRVSAQDVGLHRLPLWTDIFIAPAGFFVYFVLSALMMLAVTTFIPSFEAGQYQDTGFTFLSQQYEYILALVTLVVVAPIAEEVLFRGYLFGKLRKSVPIWAAILVTSLMFGLIHGAWNLAIDTFALSIVLCLLRLATGSLWAPILVHMTKNGIAFYLLFINPMLLNTLGG